jgi:hypothetical protein
MSEGGKKAGYNMIPPKMFDNLTKSGDWKGDGQRALAGFDLGKMEEGGRRSSWGWRNFYRRARWKKKATPTRRSSGSRLPSSGNRILHSLFPIPFHLPSSIFLF